MAKETTYEEIARDLKNRIYKPVYYLMGEESYYIDRISEYIAQTVLNNPNWGCFFVVCLLSRARFTL